MTHTFRHPKFFNELRKRNKGAQAISEQAATAADKRSPGPGQSQSDRKPASRGAGGPEGLKLTSRQASKRSGFKRCANQQALDMIPIIDGHRPRAFVVPKQFGERGALIKFY